MMQSERLKRQTPRERPEESASRKGDESVCRSREVKEEMNNLHLDCVAQARISPLEWEYLKKEVRVALQPPKSAI